MRLPARRATPRELLDSRQRRAAFALLASALLAHDGTTPLGAQGTAQPDRRPVLAVLPFTNSSLLRHAEFEPLSQGVASLLINAFASNPGVRVVEREYMNKVLAEQDFGKSGRVDATTAAQIGKLLGARYLVVGAFLVEPDGDMSLSTRAINGQTGEIEYQAVQDGEADDILKVIRALSRRISKEVKLPPAPEVREVGLARSQRGRFEATRWYSEALVEQDRGNSEAASRLLRRVLERYPDYVAAQRQLALLERKSP